MSFYATCEYCKKDFATRRQYTLHSKKCDESHQIYINYLKELNQNNLNTLNSENLIFFPDNESDEENIMIDNNIDTFTTNFPESLYLINLHNTFLKSGNNIHYNEDSEYNFGVRLLAVLKKAKCPIYVFDEIVSCMKDSFIRDNLPVKSLYTMSRKKAIDKIRVKHNITGLSTQITSYQCATQPLPINVVWHDFGQCLYTLLSDDDLMNPENLLDDINSSNEFNDITSGTVYITYYKENIKDPDTQKLIPIIFFTDKTHTDVHGRLCLEPVQFTLGIFNRNVRNESRAWRTLGYVTESIYADKKITTIEKLQDYHNILSIIFESFIDYQKNKRVWEFKCSDGIKRKKLMYLPVLFVIGDTEGHDKLCARTSCRFNIKRPCRYCNISYDNCDQPDTVCVYTKVSTIMNLVEKGNEKTLKDLSMFNVKNAMHKIEFCDPIRGIHGAVLAEVLHCLQLGIFEYAIEQLFSLKKLKKSKNKKKKKSSIIIEEEDEDDEFEFTAETDPEKLSTHWCFPKAYQGKFEYMCVFYGTILNHQSDRNLPRTKFSTEYMKTTKKNGHEMAGLLIVFLVVLCSNEGAVYLDESLGEKRCGAFIQCLELLLMLEIFCKTDVHLKSDLNFIKEMMPVVLVTIKETISRKEGCGMKIIKFHMINHFVDDIKRFGSMNNFDSSIGERNHITEVKQPAQKTQRRKNVFEQQTAERYIENIGINIACQEVLKESTIVTYKNDNCNINENQVFENKRQNMYYLFEDDNIYKFNAVTKKSFVLKNWEDKVFLKQLKKICRTLILNNNVQGTKINLFTQHNRLKKGEEKNIFRADPKYEKSGPWYDWAYINWGDDYGIVPAKLLIFIDLSNIFLKTFQIGDCYVTEKGFYALAYSFEDNPTIGGHLTSKLVMWGTLIPDDSEIIDKKKGKADTFKEHKLCIFSVDAIESPCVAVPFFPHQSIVVATQWLILVARNTWYQKFLEKLIEFKNQ